MRTGRPDLVGSAPSRPRGRAPIGPADPKPGEDLLDPAFGVAPGPDERPTDVDVVGQAQALHG